MSAVVQSCLVMYMFTIIGIGFVLAAVRGMPGVDAAYPVVRSASIALLAADAVLSHSRAGSNDWWRSGRPSIPMLASFAVLLVVTEADIFFSLALLPCLLEGACDVRSRAWSAGCGAGGFYSNSVAVVWQSCHGGGPCFFSCSIPETVRA